MHLSQIRSVYDRQGPFATVYLEGRSPSDDAPTQTRLRWKALRERLIDQEADTAALDALESALAPEEAGEVQTDGRVLVATTDGVALDVAWDAALGSGDEAYWTVAPELGGYVREEALSVRMLVVIAEQQGAVVRQEVAAGGHDLNELETSTVQKQTPHRVHKPRGQNLSHKRIQRRVDESVQQDARAIAEHLSAVAERFDPRLLVLAGEVQARTAIHDVLSADLAAICTEAERGGTDDDSAEEALAEELRRIASERSAADASRRSEEFLEANAHSLAAEGVDPVAQAADRGAVDTLLLNYNRHTGGDAELLRKCAVTDADVALADTEMAQGVGAVLRFALPAPAEAEPATG